jgi:CheY-like chemotaxis protein
MDEPRAKVLDVGNCDPDHAMIRQVLTTHFDVAVDRTMFVDQALARMRRTRYDLVLFNRLVFDDRSEGIELLRQARADETLSGIPIMMISNLDEAQQASVAAGGRPGFGKAAVSDSSTVELLSAYLPRK